jgi:UDP-N-acetylmuramoylalanine--D-glutamate ligase
MLDIPFMTILGLGESGRSVATFCRERHIPFVVVDDNVAAAKAWIKERNYPCEVFDGRGSFSFFDTLVPKNSWCVISPGVPSNHPLALKCRSRGMEVISEVECALRLVQQDPPKMIAVTGTNGKTTVVEMMCHILKSVGMRCEAIGNIGRPMIEALCLRPQPLPDWFVVELSSFQLEATYTPLFAVGCWLNLTPNHLDRHKSMEEYRQAKQRLSQMIRDDGLLLMHQALPDLDVSTRARVVRYGLTGADLHVEGDDIMLHNCRKGSMPESLRQGSLHDRENFLAAFGVMTDIGVDGEAITQSYHAFSKPHHRIEFVREYDHIKYFDDSKGTNIAATVAAVASVPGPVVLIAGGMHKGASYVPWKKAFGGKVKAIIAIGQAKQLIMDEVGDEIPVHCADTLKDAVEMASRAIPPPCSVVLSPGCSSYDMFRDYKERGQQFQQHVRTLESKP